MNIKDALKAAASPFVTFDEKPKQPQPNRQPRVKSPEVFLPNTDEEYVSGHAKAPANLSQSDIDKYQAHFEALLKDANLPGPDYYEFLKVEESLEKPLPDETTRFHAAFASLAVQGLTKDILMSSAGKYVEVIEKDQEGFHQALEQKRQAEIESRKGQMDILQRAIEESGAKIQELTRKMTEDQSKIAALNSEVATAESAIRKNADGFNTACSVVVNKIKSDIQKFQTLL